MKDQIRITVVGNSVALRVRPPEKQPDNKNYTILLEEMLNEMLPNKRVAINNKAIGASTVYNIVQDVDVLVQTFPDFYIVNLGVVDASTREVPLWFSRLATKQSHRLIHRLAHHFHRGVLYKIRPLLVKLRGKRTWISKKTFEKHFSFLIRTLQKDTNAYIIVLAINIANERIEKNLPGSKKKHVQYNKIMKKATLERGYAFMETDSLSSAIHYPDGVHFSAEGHKIIAEKIGKIILEQVK